MPEGDESLSAAALEVLVGTTEGELLDVDLASGETVTGRVDDVDVEIDGLTQCAKRSITLTLTDGRELAAHVLYSSDDDDQRLEYATLSEPADGVGEASPVDLEAVRPSDQDRLAATDGGRDG